MKPLPFAPTTRLTFDAATLMREHPPQFRHRNKQAVFEIACPPGGRRGGGTIDYTRWKAMTPPRNVDAKATTVIESREDGYDYVPTDTPAPAVEWHVNFADPHLFVAYGSGLYAQDEMQVTEHPVLGALREGLDDSGEVAQTVEKGRPTPILVRGAERRVVVATDANAVEGRPAGLYGNRFAAAPVDVVRRAARAIDPPTITNLIAMAAPVGGPGRYTLEEIEQVLTTAYTGFAAAVLESEEAAGRDARTVIHTGFWGCGAFGGNRTLMPILQMLAARLAGVERFVFHTFDAAGTARFAEARRILQDEHSKAGNDDVADFLRRLDRMGFQWGVGDGN